MVNNCLVTKLKGSVQGDLPKLEELIIPISEETRAAAIASPQHIVISGSTYSVAADGSYVKIDNKYAMTKIDSHYGDIDLEINSEDLQYSPCTIINIRTLNRVLSGSAENFPSTVQQLMWLAGESVNIEDMGHLTSLTLIGSVLQQFGNHDYVTGSVEGFVAAQRDNGRTSCEGVNFGVAGLNISTKITYQGQELTGLSKKVSWTSDGTITVTDLS